MLIDTALSEQLRGILAPLERHHTLRASAAPGHPLRDELFDLVRAVAATSDHIDAETLDGDGLTLDLLCDGHPTGIRFRAVPGGHEFSSLLLALLNADGKGKTCPTPPQPPASAPSTAPSTWSPTSRSPARTALTWCRHLTSSPSTIPASRTT